jgi:hypothetical protein
MRVPWLFAAPLLTSCATLGAPELEACLTDRKILQAYADIPGAMKLLVGGIKTDGKIRCYWSIAPIFYPNAEAFQNCRKDGLNDCTLLADGDQIVFKKRGGDAQSAELIGFLFGSFLRGAAEGAAERAGATSAPSQVYHPLPPSPPAQPALPITTPDPMKPVRDFTNPPPRSDVYRGKPTDTPRFCIGPNANTGCPESR